jgi:hypothetical protein
MKPRRSMTKRAKREARLHLPSTLIGATTGSLATYFGGRRGHARRRMAVDRGAAALRHVRTRAARGVRVQVALMRGHARGLAHRLHPTPAAELDDATLAHKVESILFRDREVPKGRISINAERGTVFLRGELENPGLIEDLEQAVRAIGGVHSVENLLHLPGTAAPHPRGGARLPP